MLRMECNVQNSCEISFIVCSHNGADKVQTALQSIALVIGARANIEVICVDSGSTDATFQAMEQWGQSVSFETSVVRQEKKGLGRARNEGISASKGGWIVFTDDDCLIREDFLTVFSKALHADFQYGGGEIWAASDDLDPRVATLQLNKTTFLEPGTVLRPGQIQGANSFFHRSVFEKVGLYGEDLGAGAKFAIEDIEMANRASLSGFRGIRLKDLVVFHDHGRRLGSQEADAVVRSYDFGRGAYYAILFAQGETRALDKWTAAFDANDTNRVMAEVSGANSAFAYIKDNPDFLDQIKIPDQGKVKNRSLIRKMLKKTLRGIDKRI